MNYVHLASIHPTDIDIRLIWTLAVGVLFLANTGKRHEFDFGPGIEIGWRFAPDYWGSGYASEAAKTVLAYGFETMGVTDIYSMSALRNKRSFGVMERIGMKVRERLPSLWTT